MADPYSTSISRCCDHQLKPPYAQGWCDPATGGGRPATIGRRLATLCQTGPMADARVYRTGRTVPPECKVCWRRWARLLRTLDTDRERRT